MKKFAFACLCIFWTQVTLAQQQDFTRYINILSTVPQLFTDWLESIDRLAEKQDREKMNSICKEVFYNVNKLRTSKETFLARVDYDPHSLKYREGVESFLKEVRSLNQVLGKSESLAKGLTGVSAIEALSGLKKDLSLKEMYLDNVYLAPTNITKDEAREILRTNLNSGISTLKNSEEILTKIIDKLEDH